eukprot:scaffold1146_cov399-Prasinococcus_capsulatus_cf.AAC.34
MNAASPHGRERLRAAVIPAAVLASRRDDGQPATGAQEPVGTAKDRQRGAGWRAARWISGRSWQVLRAHNRSIGPSGPRRRVAGGYRLPPTVGARPVLASGISRGCLVSAPSWSPPLGHVCGLEGVSGSVEGCGKSPNT